MRASVSSPYLYEWAH